VSSEKREQFVNENQAVMAMQNYFRQRTAPSCRRPSRTLDKVVAGSALRVNGCIPVALNISEGAGSVQVLA
jgi:hypothetical protein